MPRRGRGRGASSASWASPSRSRSSHWPGSSWSPPAATMRTTADRRYAAEAPEGLPGRHRGRPGTGPEQRGRLQPGQQGPRPRPCASTAEEPGRQELGGHGRHRRHRDDGRPRRLHGLDRDDVKVSTGDSLHGRDTLIDPSDALYRALADLDEGDPVTFSGRFVRDDGRPRLPVGVQRSRRQQHAVTDVPDAVHCDPVTSAAIDLPGRVAAALSSCRERPVKAWLLGVRGSTPAPGRDFVRYGGHTSCVAIAPDGE